MSKSTAPRGFSYAQFLRKKEIIEAGGDPTVEGFLPYRPPTGAYVPLLHSQRLGPTGSQAHHSPSVPPSGGGGSNRRGNHSPYGAGDRYGTSAYAPPPQAAGRPGPSSNGQPYQNGAVGGGGSKKKKKKGAVAANGRWANTTPAANASAAGPSAYSDDSMDDSEDDMMGGPSRAPSVPNSRPTSVAPPLIDSTGGRQKPLGAPDNWGRSKHKRTRLKGNVDFGKRPSKGRLDQRAPGSSDESDDSDVERLPHRSYGWEGRTDSEDSDGNPLGGRLPPKQSTAAADGTRTGAPPEPSERPPSLPPPAAPASASMPAPAGASQPNRKAQALEHFEKLRQQRRERDARAREATLAAMPPPPPPPTEAVPPSPPSADEWGPSGGWSATPQPSIMSWSATPQPGAVDDNRRRWEEDRAAPAGQFVAPVDPRRGVDPWNRRAREQAPDLASPSPAVTDKNEPVEEALETPSAVAAASSAAANESDVKPTITRPRSESPMVAPAPPPAWAASGVSGWSLQDLPANCLVGSGDRDFIRNRERFLFLKKCELENACRRFKARKWVSGALAIDWVLDTAVGQWTQPYPPDVRTAVPRKAFRDEQLELVEAKGWMPSSAADVQWPGGGRDFYQISWLDDRPVEQRERALGRPEHVAEPSPSLSPVPGPTTSTASFTGGPNGPVPPAPPDTTAGLPVRVKPEPMDVEDVAIPPEGRPSSAVAPSPAVPEVSSVEVALDNAPKAEEDPSELPTSLSAALGLTVDGLGALAESLRAADRAHDDLAAIAQAERELAAFHRQTAIIARRLEGMRRYIANTRQ